MSEVAIRRVMSSYLELTQNQTDGEIEGMLARDFPTMLYRLAQWFEGEPNHPLPSKITIEVERERLDICLSLRLHYEE